MAKFVERISRFHVLRTIDRRCSMKLALISTVLAGIASLVIPANAQEVIRDPGRCAQYYPNANCQNYGPGNPYRGSYRSRGWHGSNARMVRSRAIRHHRHMY
jgi:hypothetical protein